MQRMVIDISTNAILKVIGILLGLWLIYQVRSVVLLFFFVIIIVMALAPVIDRWQKSMSRPLAVALLIVLILASLTFIVSLLIPPLIQQTGELANNLPEYVSKFQQFLANPTLDSYDLTQRVIQAVTEQLNKLSSGILSTTIGIISGFITFLTIIVLTAYLLIEEQGLRNLLMSFMPLNRKENVANAINKAGIKLGAWLRGQLLLMVIIGVATGIWTAILGLPYSLPLGLWAGLTEVIPFLGPILGGIPIVLIAFLDSPVKALIAVGLIAITQQIESNFIVPKVMQRSVGLSPVAVILALMVGGQLFGIAGAILAVPVAATILVVVQEWPRKT